MPVFMSPSDRVTQLYSQAPGFLFAAFYDSQSCGGGILTRLHAGLPAILTVVYIRFHQFRQTHAYST
jgi:hypothetical protein